MVPTTLLANVSVLALRCVGPAYTSVPSVARVFRSGVRSSGWFTFLLSLSGIARTDRVEPEDPQVLECGKVGEEKVSSFPDSDTDSLVEEKDVGVVSNQCGGEESKDRLPITLQFALPMGESERNRFRVHIPGDEPITRGSDLFGGSRGPKLELDPTDDFDITVIVQDGESTGEDVIEVDHGSDDDVSPFGIWELWRVRRGED